MLILADNIRRLRYPWTVHNTLRRINFTRNILVWSPFFQTNIYKIDIYCCSSMLMKPPTLGKGVALRRSNFNFRGTFLLVNCSLTCITSAHTHRNGHNEHEVLSLDAAVSMTRLRSTNLEPHFNNFLISSTSSSTPFLALSPFPSTLYPHKPHKPSIIAHQYANSFPSNLLSPSAANPPIVPPPFSSHGHKLVGSRLSTLLRINRSISVYLPASSKLPHHAYTKPIRSRTSCVDSSSSHALKTCTNDQVSISVVSHNHTWAPVRI